MILGRGGRDIRKKAPFLYYLNPGNVSAAIATYGFTYQVKNTVLVYLAVMAQSVSEGCLIRLGIHGVCIVTARPMSINPRVIINIYLNMYEQKRF